MMTPLPTKNHEPSQKAILPDESPVGDIWQWYVFSGRPFSTTPTLEGSDSPGVTIFDHEFDFSRRQHCVDRVDHGTDAGDGEVAHDPFTGIGGIKSNHIALTDSKTVQPTRGFLYECV